jgi:cysteinyl-tRNA synthetase
MTGTNLTLYNSLTRQLERFAPIHSGKVGIYSCGPTVYNYAHIGNLRAYVFTDTLSRVLTWKGYDLTHIINITDVGHLTSDADAGDDKMEAAARAANQDIWAIARHYTDAFKRNLSDLNIREPSRFPLATDHVPEMIAFAERIADAHCYLLPDGLYFDTTTVPDYGRLARSQDDVGEGRIDPVAGKRHPQDFAIWRTSQPGENRQMEWDSPWGRGAPGWHLECSVMSKKYLGDQFDIHTGGIDHREIHHPNEIAQNQADCDCADTGATLWMHNNFLVERSGKMSKSGGDFTTLQTLVDRGFHPLAYRLMCLQAHYRSELEFSWENLMAASRRLHRLALNVRRNRADSFFMARLRKAFDASQPDRQTSINTVLSTISGPLASFVARFDKAISNDLGTPECLMIVEEVLKSRSLTKRDKSLAVAFMDEVIGLGLSSISRRKLRLTARVSKAPIAIVRSDIDALVKARRLLRQAGERELADNMRDVLQRWGVEVMDGDPLGWDWKIEI